MSGPWDRPPSSTPDDRDWPAEDLEPRSSADRPVEPWSADDPWQERRDPSPGWDEWPPPAPSADDYAVEQSAPPASDPWAESWADEVPGIPTSPPPELESESQPAPDTGYESSEAPAFEPPEASPVPSFEPSFDEAEASECEAESRGSRVRGSRAAAIRRRRARHGAPNRAMVARLRSLGRRLDGAAGRRGGG